MNMKLVLRAVGLFYMTEDAADVDPREVYGMESELCQILKTLNDEETLVYQKLIDYKNMI